jgi:hypothetical protein
MSIEISKYGGWTWVSHSGGCVEHRLLECSSVKFGEGPQTFRWPFKCHGWMSLKVVGLSKVFRICAFRLELCPLASIVRNGCPAWPSLRHNHSVINIHNGRCCFRQTIPYLFIRGSLYRLAFVFYKSVIVIGYPLFLAFYLLVHIPLSLSSQIPWRWNKNIPSKRCFLYTKISATAFKKTLSLMLIIIRKPYCRCSSQDSRWEPPEYKPW